MLRIKSQPTSSKSLREFRAGCLAIHVRTAQFRHTEFSMTTSPCPVCVALPVYQAELSPPAQVALTRCIAVLGTYLVVKPESQRIDALLIRHPSLLSENFRDEFFADMKGQNRLLLSKELCDRFAAYNFMLIHRARTGFEPSSGTARVLYDYCQASPAYIRLPNIACAASEVGNMRLVADSLDTLSNCITMLVLRRRRGLKTFIFKILAMALRRSIESAPCVQALRLVCDIYGRWIAGPAKSPSRLPHGNSLFISATSVLRRAGL